jgi:hypothetical protein
MEDFVGDYFSSPLFLEVVTIARILTESFPDYGVSIGKNKILIEESSSNPSAITLGPH